MMHSFNCHSFIVFVSVVLINVDAYLLVVKKISVDSRETILRGYSAYLKGSGALKLACSAPDWATAKGVEWSGEGIDGSAAKDALTLTYNMKSGNFVCFSDSLKHGKSVENLENATVKFYRAGSDVTISVTPSNFTFVNYTSPPDYVALKCSSSSNAGDIFKWYLDGLEIAEGDRSNVRLHTDGTLNISRPSYRDVGVYVCKSNADKDKLNFFSVQGPAYFPLKHGKRDSSENKLEESSVIVEHEIYGNPLDKFEWFVSEEEDGTKIHIDEKYLNEHPNVRLSPSVNVTNGILELINLDKKDRAHYFSDAKNTFGDTVTFKTLIRVKGKLDALWPFLGIVAEVIILVAIILIYERRRLKQDQEAEEALDQKKPLTATNSEGARQRKN